MPAAPNNTTGSLSGKIIVQTALSLLFAKFPALSKITTDFTAGRVPLLGQQVTSRIFTVPQVGRKTKGQPFVSAPTNTTDVSVMVDTHGYCQVSFDIADQASTDRNLLREQAQPIVVALGNDFMAALMANVTPGNFKNEIVYPTADASRKTLVQLQGALSGRNVSDVNRVALLSLPYYTALEDDDSIVRSDYRGANEDQGIGSGRIMPTAGFETIDYFNLLPATNNLLGIACNNEALVIASRLPNDLATQNPDIPIPGKQYVVSDKRTGLAVLVTEYFDLDYGIVTARVEWMFGTAVGNPLALERVVSAATAVAGTVVDFAYGA